MREDFIEDWDLFLAPYAQAVAELKVKLKNIRQEFHDLDRHAPIEFVTGRVKSKESILEKIDEGIRTKDIVKSIKKESGLSKNEIYEYVLELSKWEEKTEKKV